MMQVRAIDHVQIAMPEEGEAAAVGFYADVLGFEPIQKPKSMQRSGGCWFRSGRAELHLGVEADFRPALKAHPAFRVTDLDCLAERCEAAGHSVQWDDRYPNIRRFYVHDPFGNRVELLQADAVTLTHSPDTSSLEIRRVRGEDRDPLLALLRDLHPSDDEPARQTVDRVWQELLNSESVRVYVGVDEGRLIGTCTLALVPNLTRGARPFGLIENVVTAKGERRQGVGGALLEYALNEAWAEGCYKVMLLSGSTRPETIRFYERAGFVRDQKEGFVSFPRAPRTNAFLPR